MDLFRFHILVFRSSEWISTINWLIQPFYKVNKYHLQAKTDKNTMIDTKNIDI